MTPRLYMTAAQIGWARRQSEKDGAAWAKKQGLRFKYFENERYFGILYSILADGGLGDWFEMPKEELDKVVEATEALRKPEEEVLYLRLSQVAKVLGVRRGSAEAFAVSRQLHRVSELRDGSPRYRLIVLRSLLEGAAGCIEALPEQELLEARSFRPAVSSEPYPMYPSQQDMQKRCFLSKRFGAQRNLAKVFTRNGGPKPIIKVKPSFERPSDTTPQGMAINFVLDNEKSGILYVLENPAMPGIVKIGLTVRSAQDRANDLFSVSTPAPFIVKHAALVQSVHDAETAVHSAFKEERVNRNREFFAVSVEDAVQQVNKQAFMEVTRLFDPAEIRRRHLLGLEPIPREHHLEDLRMTV